jgi:predicted nucleic acid-binding Zn ribbon protein
MTRRTPTKSQAKRRDWRTTLWYVIGILIVLTMVISLVASAFVN